MQLISPSCHVISLFSNLHKPVLSITSQFPESSWSGSSASDSMTFHNLTQRGSVSTEVWLNFYQSNWTCIAFFWLFAFTDSSREFEKSPLPINLPWGSAFLAVTVPNVSFMFIVINTSVSASFLASYSSQSEQKLPASYNIPDDLNIQASDFGRFQTYALLLYMDFMAQSLRDGTYRKAESFGEGISCKRYPTDDSRPAEPQNLQVQIVLSWGRSEGASRCGCCNAVLGLRSLKFNRWGPHHNLRPANLQNL